MSAWPVIHTDNSQNKEDMKKTVLVLGLAIAAAATSWAGPVKDAFAKISQMPDIGLMDVPESELSDAPDAVKSAKIAILPAAKVAEVKAVVEALPDSLQWLSVNEAGSQVIIYGEETDTKGVYDTIMFIDTDDQDILLYVTGTQDMLDHLNIAGN